MNLLKNKLGNSLLVEEMSGLEDKIAAPALALEAALLVSGTSVTNVLIFKIVYIYPPSLTNVTNVLILKIVCIYLPSLISVTNASSLLLLLLNCSNIRRHTQARSSSDETNALRHT